ncbi:hypothetical protein MGYG_02660 [Nannizzia gypsea CBS 118893]|uniref:HRQ family protein 2 n=1 Tax=Arthroderma gypseum (strain ATCC MYA-4604 / CBS 118893) TaxID=535722 RepID=E4UNP4_ARTGP|nr:hypothetical protein MGYG_02660 [Nannizzia gypsea CBS 118893]EFQ99647.1 hypothetical protein MGYG_02660 [Nannizzia gypsea CBS 118893]
MEKAISDIIMPYWHSVWEFLVQLRSQIPTNVLLLLPVVAMIWYRSRSDGPKSPGAVRKLTVVSEDDFPPIQPLDKFNWETTEPMKLRPYKPKYNLTMALETLEPSELIPIDKEYKDRISERRKVLKEHYDIALGIHPASSKGESEVDGKELPLAHDAICELYEFVMGIYLPNRYPTMFKLIEAKYESCKVFMLQNKVTGEVLPASVSPGRPLVNALETLAKTIDEDMLILLPAKDKDKDAGNERRKESGRAAGSSSVKYVLQAYVTCFPSGFNTREKLGKQLKDVHEPVPGYREKIERSMDRYFEKLEVGKFVKRVNWGITTGAGLFYAFGDERLATTIGQGVKQLRLEELDIDDASTFLRCERQTLYRLPKSGAIVFSIHTYRYPIRQLKEEGSGDDLAAAIEGIENGNVPLMAEYKKVPAWGEAVKEYLRS